jgi:hypothetical protein
MVVRASVRAARRRCDFSSSVMPLAPAGRSVALPMRRCVVSGRGAREPAADFLGAAFFTTVVRPETVPAFFAVTLVGTFFAGDLRAVVLPADLVAAACLVVFLAAVVFRAAVAFFAGAFFTAFLAAFFAVLAGALRAVVVLGLVFFAALRAVVFLRVAMLPPCPRLQRDCRALRLNG